MQLSPVYMVNPADIRFSMNPKSGEFNIKEYHESTVPGDWDLNPLLFDRSLPGIMVRSLSQMDSGAKWEDTEYWKFLENSISKGVCHCGVKNIKDLHNRCYVWMQKLVDDVRSTRILPEKWTKNDHISVNIDRYGRMIFNNGRHRLGVVKYFGVKSIPVTITVRHPGWVEFKNRIRGYAEQHGGVIYSPTSHMDLQDIPSYHQVDRIESIAKSMGRGVKTVLDVGANWGHCCSYLSRIGMVCRAVENDVEALRFMKSIKVACQDNFGVFEGSVFDFNPRGYDVILALRIFHHFLKNKSTFDRLVGFLRNLDASEMYFQPHDISTQNMSGAYRNFDNKQFLDFIVSNSTFKFYKEIGRFVGGPVFKLWQ